MENNNKIIAMVALIVAVIGLGVGFAAFSSTLTINTEAAVNPVNTFKVVFSTSPKTSTTGEINVGGGATSAAQAAGLSGSTILEWATTVTGSATVAEDKVTDLTANFTDPGQQVIFTFYVRNVGEYIAYLNSIKFEKLTGKEVKKECVAGEGATDSLVQAACEGISISINVQNKAATDDLTITTPTSLDKGKQGAVKVTIEYAYGSARADGPFTVNFGDIKLNYSTAA